jgi:DNA-directed RNA polymerase specialized sigma24 family protein
MQHTKMDTAFLYALQKRNQTAFEKFYNEYAPAFYGDIKKTLPAQQLADETLAGAFVKIWHVIDQYDPSKERLFTWSLKVVRKETSQRKMDLVLNELFSCRYTPPHNNQLQQM